MENKDFQKLWKQTEDKIEMKSNDELQLILETKIHKTLTKFYFQYGVSILVCISFFIFLLITALNRGGDIYYQLNNLFIGLIVAAAFFSVWFSFYKFRRNENNLPLKQWLAVRIRWISKSISGSLVWFLLPILAAPTILSIHVYYEYKPFAEVITTEESVFGLSFGLLAGLAVAYFSVRKIRNYQKRQLEHLRSLYSKLTDL